jgi:hypothetical protein
VGNVRNKIRLAGLALQRAIRSPVAPTKEINVLIVSPGGVATTVLIEHISKYVKTNSPHDEDALKHMPRPPNWLNRTQKVIFIAGDADAILKSIKFHGWIPVQGAKLGSIAAATLPSPLNCPPFKGAVRKQIAQWARWCSKKDGNSLLIDYEEVWSSAMRIAEFCNITDPSFLGTFPSKRRRTSA